MPNLFEKTQKFHFSRGMPLHFAIMLCKESQRMLCGITGKYSVKDTRSAIQEPSQLTAILSEVGAKKMKENLEEIVQYAKFKKRPVSKYGLDFLAEKIMEENDYEVAYCISTCDDKHISRIDVYGNDGELFLNELDKYIEDYIFDSHQILCKIVMGRMKCKIPEDSGELVFIACGNNTLVYPTGPKADEFYNEFLETFKSIKSIERDFPGQSDEELINICKDIRKSIKDVYCFIKKSTVFLKGFPDTVEIFVETIPIHLDRKKSPSPRVKFNKTPEIVDVMEEELCDVSFGN